MTPALLKELESAINFSKFRSLSLGHDWDEADVLEIVTQVLIDHESPAPVGEGVEDVCFSEHKGESLCRTTEPAAEQPPTLPSRRSKT